mmetsp:Transcript_18184/g.29570  ORF Transcript_18184/g.29570 Transcript_18184/m.29570 type:complete len:504 (-) Transcript_18184:131-1642(-)
MPRYALLAAFLCAGGVEQLPSADLPGQCDGLSDDCVDGYTSLLQDSLHFHQVHASPRKLAAMPQRRTANADVRLTTAQQSGSDNLAGLLNEEFSHSHMTSLKWIAFLGVAVFISGAVGYFLFVGIAESVARYNATQGARGIRGTEPRGTASVLQAVMVDVHGDDEVESRTHDGLDEDTYSCAIALVVRDLTDLSLMEKGSKKKGLKYARILFACCLALFTSVLEISLVVCTKKFVTPQQVASIRDAYDQFEVTMYDSHTYINKNGKNRGIVGFFNASLFDTLDDDTQGDVCNIPISQVGFIGIILVVWSVTCFAQIKSTIENFMALLFFAATVDSMANALEERRDENSDGDSEDSDDGERKCQVIVGLTLPVKLMLTIFIFLPDLGTASYVLWLGSRWLLATNDFGNLISNAVALEFILQLKNLLYLALVSDRNKRDLHNTGLAPPWDKEPAGYGVYFNSMTWAILSLLWVWAYLFHFQQVLPDYHWDVHSVCTPWLYSQLSS